MGEDKFRRNPFPKKCFKSYSILPGLFSKFVEFGHKMFKYLYNPFIFGNMTGGHYHPIANNKIFITRTKIQVTLATQVGEVAASKKKNY